MKIKISPNYLGYLECKILTQSYKFRHAHGAMSPLLMCQSMAINGFKLNARWQIICAKFLIT